MVFSSLPAYLDPSNWQQQPNIQAETGNSQRLLTNSHLLPPPPPPPPPPQPHGDSGGMGTIKPGSMADRARLANIPMPEAAQKCPRCESYNTKFCYFNNYSLSQPRHFCKTCRRYWTRGGALRNVPVGGGCRRNNKRSSKAVTTTTSSSKSPVVISSPSGSSSNSGATDIYSSLGISPSQLNPLRFMSPMAHLGHHDQFINYGANNNDLNFQIGSLNLASNSNNGGSSSFPIMTGLEQWRLQHQFLGGFDSNSSSSTGLLPFEAHDAALGYGGIMNNFKPKISNSVKMEDNNVTQEVNLSRQFLGLSGNDHAYNWSNHGGSSAWTDLSSFSSSSTSNH